MHATLLGKRHGHDASSRNIEGRVAEGVPKPSSSDAPRRIFVVFAVNDNGGSRGLRGQSGALNA